MQLLVKVVRRVVCDSRNGEVSRPLLLLRILLTVFNSPQCKKFADRYIEFDFVIVFIDLVLIKPQVCRVRGCRNRSDRETPNYTNDI